MPWIDEKTADALSELMEKAREMIMTPTNTEINKTIFKALHPDGCWHESDNEHCIQVRCSKCGKSFGDLIWPAVNPDYCSESSPRSLLAEAEKAAIEKFGAARFMTALIENVKAGFSVEQENDMSEIDCAAALVTAPASIRARAIAALPWDEEGK